MRRCVSIFVFALGVVSSLPVLSRPVPASWPWATLAAQSQATTRPAIPDSASIAGTVHALGAVVRREYMDPALGDELSELLERRLAEGAYAGVDSRTTLARRLTADLFSVTHDKHLAVIEIPAVTPGGSSSPPADALRRAAVRRSNGGVRHVEILPGNVGYLDLSSFWRLSEGRRQVGLAMHLLAGADALIVDMRDNGGGSPEMVAYVLSYCFDRPRVPLFDITPRYGTPTRYTTSRVPGADGRRPLFVLTAAQSFSGAEGIAFLLQERGRAEVIGEVTAGAANPGRPYPVNALFEVVVPNGRLRSAVSGGNWEGAGVTPDVAAPAADARRTAHARALTQLLRTAATETDRTRLLTALNEVSHLP